MGGENDDQTNARKPTTLKTTTHSSRLESPVLPSGTLHHAASCAESLKTYAPSSRPRRTREVRSTVSAEDAALPKINEGGFHRTLCSAHFLFRCAPLVCSAMYEFGCERPQDEKFWRAVEFIRTLLFSRVTGSCPGYNKYDVLEALSRPKVGIPTRDACFCAETQTCGKSIVMVLGVRWGRAPMCVPVGHRDAGPLVQLQIPAWCHNLGEFSNFLEVPFCCAESSLPGRAPRILYIIAPLPS